MREDQHTEWKSSWHDEYLKWICGFANAQGGALEIGRNDKAEPEYAVTDGFVTTIRRRVSARAQVRPKSGSARAHEAHEAHVTLLPWEIEVLRACAQRPATGHELMSASGYSSRTGNFKRGLDSLLANGLLEMTLPDKPRSRAQSYRLAPAGRLVLGRIDRKRAGQ